MGIQSGEPWRWLTTATTASIRSRYSAYSGTSVRDGISCAMNVTFSRNSGCCSRNTSKALNPRSDTLHRVGVDRQRIRAPPHLAPAARDHALLVVGLEPGQVLAALQEVP